MAELGPLTKERVSFSGNSTSIFYSHYIGITCSLYRGSHKQVEQSLNATGQVSYCIE